MQEQITIAREVLSWNDYSFFAYLNRADIRALLMQISAARYEGKPCTGRIDFVRCCLNSLPYSKETVWFSEEIPFKIENKRLIRKLLEGTDEHRRLIVNRKTEEILGIGNVYNQVLSEEVISIDGLEFIGVLEWNVFIAKKTKDKKGKDNYKETKKFTCKNGKYEAYDADSDDKEFREKYKNLFDAFGEKEEMLKRCKEIYKLVRDQKHGTMLVITEKDFAESEIKRLAKWKRGIELKEGTSKSRKALNDNPTIRTLTAVDGCILYDSEGACYGFGVILDGVAKEKGEQDRGARYNSALTYVYANEDEKIMACVFSEDGGSDIIVHRKYVPPK